MVPLLPHTHEIAWLVLRKQVSTETNYLPEDAFFFSSTQPTYSVARQISLHHICIIIDCAKEVQRFTQFLQWKIMFLITVDPLLILIPLHITVV